MQTDYCEFRQNRSPATGVNLDCIPSSSGGTQVAELIVHGNSDGDIAFAQVQCSVGGGGGSGILQVMPTSLSFGTIDVGAGSQQAVMVFNAGTADLDNVAVSIDDTSDYMLDCGTCQLGTVGPNNTRTVNVTFAPTAGSDLSTTLRVTADGVAGSKT